LQQLTPLCVEVNKRKADLQPVEVLGNAAIVHLAEPEDASENAEGMFHMGTHPGLCAILGHFFSAERQSAVTAMMGEILYLRCGCADRLALALLCAIAPHARFLAMQDVFDHPAVMHIGGRRRHRVDNLGLAINADVRLQAEIPGVAFLRLVHFGIALAVFILCRGGRSYGRGIHDRAGANLDTSGAKVLVDCRKQPLTQSVAFNQMAKLARLSSRPAPARAPDQPRQKPVSQHRRIRHPLPPDRTD
jgi:hypothetical protein